MDNEPTKAAIERACEITGYSVPDYHWQVTEHPKKRTRLWNATNAVARHLDQVSETNKLDDGMLTSVAAAIQVVRERDAGRNGLIHNLQRLNEWLHGAERDALILPDPEPDVLAEALIEYFDMQRISQGDVDGVRQMLKKRGYAITKTGEAGQ